MEYNFLPLNQIADSVTEKISTDDISTLNYISTENMIVNKAGVEEASKLPNIKKVNFYRKKDVLISNIRPYFKKIWQADRDGGASADVLIYRANPDYINEDYLYYFLSQDRFFEFMVQTSKGTKMPRGDKNAISNYEVRFPKNIVYQRKVASIGRTIDEKIKLNKETIANLEELSQTLFKRWFIDFEFPDENGKPYKSNNGHMIESDFGPIPVNFKIGKIEDICELKYGKALPKAKRIAGKYPVYGSGGVTGTHNDFLVSGPGIIIGRKGTIGSIYIEFNDFFPIDTVFYIQSELYSINFLYQLFQSLNFKDSNNDSAVPGLNRNFVYQTQIVIPNSFIANEFDSLIEPLSSLISIKLKENNELVILRDTLLPKLMSGEIELPDELEEDDHAELLQ